MFVILAGNSFAQVQVQKLMHPNGAIGHRFGTSVAVQGDTAVLVGNGSSGTESTIYVYRRSSGVWGLKQVVAGPPPGPGSTNPSALAIDGDWIVLSRKKIHLFHQDLGVWQHSQSFVVDKASCVALAGKSLAVGSAVVKTVHLYDLIAGVWTKTGELHNQIPEEEFGTAVAMDGDWLLVGAPLPYWIFPYNIGRAYFYQRTIGSTGSSQWTWTQVVKGDFGDGFAKAVALDGRTAMVGATFQFDTGSPGMNRVHVFNRGPTGTWSAEQVFGITDSFCPHANFGRSISLVGDEAIIGANQYCSDGNWHPTGAAYHYRRLDSGWTQLGRLRTSDQARKDETGTSVALAGGQALVGVPGRDDDCLTSNCNSGAVYVFSLAPDSIQICSCHQSGPCNNSEQHGGCDNSTNQGAVLAAGGSSSVADDTLLLEGRWLPPAAPVVWRIGDAALPTAFGDGLECLTNAQVLHSAFADSGGVARLGPGIVAMSQVTLPPSLWIQAGQLRTFQCYYRDPAGPCGTGFNQTNGLKVEFTQ